MDSQDKNESRIRRQESLARRLGEALDQLKPHGAADCPDTDVIAAYAEQALGPDESAQWEGHFASCTRCRNILRVLGASADAPLAEKEVAQLGQLVSAVRAPIEITAGKAQGARPQRVDWRKRWLAPAIGVAAVLAVWFAMRPPWRVADRGASETLVAQAPRNEMPASPAPPAVDRFSNVAPPQNLKKEATLSPEGSAAQTAPLNSPTQSPVNGRLDSGAAVGGVSPSEGETLRSLQQQKKLSAPMEGREAQPPASPSVPPPTPKARIAMQAQAAPQAEAKASSGNAVAESAPAPASGNANANAAVDALARDKQPSAPRPVAGALVVPEASSRLSAGARKPQSAADLKTTEPASVQATAPFGSTVWRMGKNGRVERSADAGETWVLQASPSQEEWLAAVAVSDTVCWVAGRNGSIARTTDGERWERIAPPAQGAANGAALPDLTGITARDAQSATITASDGRKFSTADGGRTWQRQ